MTTEFYLHRNSLIHRRDPRVKLLLTMIISVMAFFMASVIEIFSLLILVHALYLLAKIPLSRILQVWRILLPINIMILILWPLLSPQGSSVIFNIGRWSLSWEAVWAGIHAAIRIDVLALIASLLLITSDQNSLVMGLVKLGLPYSLGLSLSLALRFLPNFFATLKIVQNAQKSRGLDINEFKGIDRAKAYFPLLITVIVTALKTGVELSHTLETRGYGRPIKRVYYQELRFNKIDTVFILSTLVLFGAVIYFRLS